MSRRHRIVCAALLPDGTKVALQAHTVDRYVERVKPALSFTGAIDDLRRLLDACGEVVSRPEWVHGNWAAERDLCDEKYRWVALGDAIAFVAIDSDGAADLLLVTCVTRGGISDLAASHRQQRRRKGYVPRRQHKKKFKTPYVREVNWT